MCFICCQRMIKKMQLLFAWREASCEFRYNASYSLYSWSLRNVHEEEDVYLWTWGMDLGRFHLFSLIRRQAFYSQMQQPRECPPQRGVLSPVVVQYTHHVPHHCPILTKHHSNGPFKWLKRRQTRSSERLLFTNHFSTQLINFYGFLSWYFWNILLTVTIRKRSQVQ